MVTLTKSLFTAGQQCPKLLWWKVHEPGALELQPDKVLQDRFDQGAQVGALAQAFFPGAEFEKSYEASPSSVRSSGQAPTIRIRLDVLESKPDGTRTLTEFK